MKFKGRRLVVSRTISFGFSRVLVLFFFFSYFQISITICVHLASVSYSFAVVSACYCLFFIVHSIEMYQIQPRRQGRYAYNSTLTRFHQRDYTGFVVVIIVLNLSFRTKSMLYLTTNFKLVKKFQDVKRKLFQNLLKDGHYKRTKPKRVRVITFNFYFQKNAKHFRTNQFTK